MRFFSICTASRRFRECQNASGGNASEISFRESGTREQIAVSSPCHVDEILSCWDESWESFIETRKTHQFPGISDRSILQRQQHHCAQSHWRWRMKTPFNNIAYSGASAPVQTFFTRGEMIDCIRAHRSRSQNCTRTGAINIPWPSVCFSYSAWLSAE